jgi:SNF2 family DNA or RNA helicase
MKVEISGELASITGPGLQMIRLKAKLSQVLDLKTSANATTISVPVACLPLVRELVDSKADFSQEALAVTELFEKHASARVESLCRVNDGNFADIPERWQSILEPSQATAVSAMCVPGLLGFCLFDEQGSGKTVMSIAAFDILTERGEIDAAIIVCPKSMLSEWRKDLLKFTNNRHRIAVVEGSHQEKLDTVYGDFNVFIVNYEGLSNLAASLKAQAKVKRFLFIADESFLVKNSQTLRADRCNDVRESCLRCFVLCGTPAPNSADDLINQFNLADRGFTFAGFQKPNDSELNDAKIQERSNERGTFIRRLKTEILENVPDKQFEIVRVKLKGRQAQMYDSARRELELNLRTLNNDTFKRSLATYFQKRSALLQICVCPSAIDPLYSEIPAKLEPLDRLIDDLISKKRKVVIWTFYKESVKELKSRYARHNVVVIEGSVSSPDRQDAVTKFQNDPNCMIFIGNPSAAGAGITLHASYDSIYVSYSNQAAHYIQSLDRTHRRGQTAETVNYYLICCEGTIEETEIKRLRAKEVGQAKLLGDEIKWPSSLDEAIEELRGND